MKKVTSFMPIAAMIVLMSVFCSCEKKKVAPEVGTLTAYYAKEDFSVNDREYKKGKLICDSNDPLSHVSDEDESNFRYSGDDGVKNIPGSCQSRKLRREYTQ